jgi:hypothetical protein
LNATQLFPFVLIADHTPDAFKVANLSTIVLSEFYVYKKTPTGDSYTWYDAVPCVDYFTTIFGSFDNIPRSLQSELVPIHNTTWMCPNFPITGESQFTLQNDPWQYNFGEDLNYAVNYCWVSAIRKGIVDPNCVTNNSTLDIYIKGTRVSHKFVRQFFNPTTILENQGMEYIGEQRMESDFNQIITPSNNFLVTWN